MATPLEAVIFQLPGGIISDDAIHGIGPNPRENTVMKITRLTMGTKPMLFRVASSTSFLSCNVKKIPRRMPESAMQKAEPISRIFRPNLSTMSEEMNVATT